MKVLSPGLDMVTVSVPDVAFDPDHAPDAEHEVAFVLDHVNSVSSDTRTDVGFAEILIVGAGVVGVS